MNPIERLMNEHRQIEKAMDVLEIYAGLVSRNDPVVVQQDLKTFVTFIKRYADAYHHAKEEGILFEEMVRFGFPKEQGPIAMMLMEHDEGRNFTNTLAESCTVAGFWEESDRRSIEQNALGFTSLLRQHIMKEDNVLYPMSMKHIPMEAWKEIEKRFEDIEAQFAKTEEMTKLVAAVTELSAKYPKK